MINSQLPIDSLPWRTGAKTIGRFGFLWILLLGISGILLSRSFWLQVVLGKELLTTAEQNHIAAYPLLAPRGLIFDNAGRRLVDNIASSDIVLNPVGLPLKEHEAPLFELLPDVLNISPDKLREAINRARVTQRTVLLARAVSHEIVLELEEILPRVSGMEIASSSVRKYPDGNSVAHVVGYTGSVTQEDVDARSNLLSTSITGKTGLEKYYDEILRGTDGAEYKEVDATGRPQKYLGEKGVVAGADLTLTIDSEFQKHIYGLLKERIDNIQGDWEVLEEQKVVRGAVVALDPRNGAVKALVSFPGFDPNLFSRPDLAGQTQTLFSDSTNPLFNRATDGTYPPGSTIKPLLAAAALDAGIITANTTVLSTGGISVGPWNFPDWKAGGHGTVDVNKAIAESVNTFFYAISGGAEGINGLGVNKITEYLGDFGWGSPTGIDLPQEAPGFLPSPEWKEEAKGERWYIGDTYHLGIGQGDVLVTPLQVASATATLAVGGVMSELHLVDKYTLSDGAAVEYETKAKRIPIRVDMIDIARQGMRETVVSGSGQRLSTLDIPLAGKTGTAQTGKEDVSHAWFTSFGPYTNPELVLTVLLEEGGQGDVDAVPLASQIWEWWIKENSRAVSN